MADPNLHPDLIRIRDKYPASKCLHDDWEKIKKMVQDGKSDEAEAYAKDCLNNSQRLKVRNAVAVKHRILRRDYLRFQRDLENEIRNEFDKMQDRIEKKLINAADENGKIPFAKIRPIQDFLKDVNTETFASVTVLIKRGVRKSIEFGIIVTMQSAQHGLDLKKKLNKESVLYHSVQSIRDLQVVYEQMASILEAESKAIFNKTSLIFKTIFDRIKKRRIEKGLSTKRMRGVYQSGFSLSRQVWDIRDGNLQRLRRSVASGIAQGRAASAIANDVKGMTTVGRAGDVAVTRGVYRSAYKNALRLTRTETNNAYVDAELEYAAHKGYKKMWNTTQSPCPICALLDVKIFSPDNVPYPAHPNDACWLSTVIPEVG